MSTPWRWVRGYALWTTPRHVMIYVLIVNALTVFTTIATSFLPVVTFDWAHLAILTGCAIAHVELSRSIERVRKLASGVGPLVDGLTVWHFAAVLILPMPLATALVAATQTYVWFRVWRGARPLYKGVFSTATIILATQAASLILDSGPGPHPGIPSGWVGLAFVLAAAAVRWLINYTLVLGAILVSSPDLRARQIVGEFGEQVLEAGAMGIGLAAAGLALYDPRLLLGIVIGLYALHRSVLVPQFRHASRTDDKTGLHTPTWWHQIATGAFARTVASRSSIAVLMLDLDHFKRLNDTHGHLAGDAVLRAVSNAIVETVRSDDTACRWGGEEFAVLLPHVTVGELRSIAERVRRQVSALVVDIGDDQQPAQVTDLTISIGGALYPSPGINSLDQLQLAADTALYAAKEAGRNCVHLAAHA